MMAVVFAGAGTGGMVIVALLGIVLYRRAKIPFVIKKIDQSMKLISKGEVPQRVPMRTRAELLSGIFLTKLEIMSKEKLEEAGGKKGRKKVSEEAPVSEEEAPMSQEELAAPPAAETIPKGAKKPPEPVIAEETDVDLVAKELEKLEAKEEKKPSDESDLVKREIEELEKRSKKRKRDESG